MNEQNKKPSLWGFLFNPKIGNDIKPLGEALSGFVNLIAMIFASYRLFPRNHPALIPGSNIKLTLAEVIATAWNEVKFTKEGVPQAVMFFAVTGTLLFSALFVITFVLSLFVGVAHAQTSTPSQGMFTAPNKSCDLAYLWLDYLFMGQDINASSTCKTALAVIAPSSQSIQSALKQALAFYSSGVLVLAGILLFYHLTAMVVETAHSGKPMGNRANQIWAPIRLVVAIGLLVPIGSGGLNSGQHIVVQMAKWGSGLASNTWQIFLTGISKQDYTLKVPPLPNTMAVSAGIVKMQACMMAFNAVLAKNDVDLQKYTVHPAGTTVSADGTITRSSYPPNDCSTEAPWGLFSEAFGKVNKCHFGFGSEAYPDICGYIDLKPTPKPSAGPSAEVNTAVADLYRAHLNAVGAVVYHQTLENVGNNIYGYLKEAYRPQGYDSKQKASFDDFAQLYQKTLKSTVGNVGMGTRSAMTQLTNTWSEQGWVTAGSWFNTIARAQSAVLDAAKIPVPEVRPPSSDWGLSDWAQAGTSIAGAYLNPFSSGPYRAASIMSEKATIGNIFTETTAALDEFMKKNVQVSGLSSSTTLAPSPAGTMGESTAVLALPVQAVKPTSSAMDTLLQEVGKLGAYYGLWPKEGFGFQFGKDANPLAELAYFGHQNMNMGFEVLAYAFGGSLISGLDIPFLSSVSGAAASLGTIIGYLFIISGVSLGFLLPLLPFLKFFFNVITWITVVFEAVVAAPIFALAHLSPYGEGLPGGMAQRGYFFLVDILLRPTLMIFGLMAGFLIFFVGIHFLNMTYSFAVAGTGGTIGSLAGFGKIFYSIAYTALAYILANSCFKMITHFPNHALAWIGQQGPVAKDMGDPGFFNSKTGLVGAYVGQQLTDNMKSGLSGVSGQLRKARSKGEEQEKSAQNKMKSEAALADDRNFQSRQTKSITDALGKISSESKGMNTPDNSDIQPMSPGSNFNSIPDSGPLHSSNYAGAVGRVTHTSHTQAEDIVPPTAHAGAPQNPPEERQNVDIKTASFNPPTPPGAIGGDRSNNVTMPILPDKKPPDGKA